MKRGILMSALVVLTVVSTGYCSNSTWKKRNKNTKGFYADDKAMEVGDVLTIIINEDYKVDNKVDRKLSKTTSHSVDFNGDNVTLEHLVPSIPSMKLEGGGSKSLNGKADYKDERSIEDRITVVVMDVHPNGNLVVMGTRTREVSGDKQVIQASGIVDPDSVLFDNTVRSDQVANFKLVSNSDGVTGSYIEPGWLAKIFDAIWPF